MSATAAAATLGKGGSSRDQCEAEQADDKRDDEIAPFVLAANNSSAGAETMTEEHDEAASEPVSEPAGWAIAPEAAAGATAAAVDTRPVRRP